MPTPFISRVLPGTSRQVSVRAIHHRLKSSLRPPTPSPSCLPQRHAVPSTSHQRQLSSTSSPPPAGVTIGGQRIAYQGDHIHFDPSTKQAVGNTSPRPSGQAGESTLAKDDPPRPSNDTKGAQHNDRSFTEELNQDDFGLDVGSDGVVRGNTMRFLWDSKIKTSTSSSKSTGGGGAHASSLFPPS